jgi:UDP-N-acetyl-D-glucosamine dehydrogenase
VDYHDPHIPVIRPTREHPHFAGRRAVALSGDYDLLLLATAHDEYRAHDFSSLPVPLVDTRNCVTHRPRLYYRA